jgi:hypothetical protein
MKKTLAAVFAIAALAAAPTALAFGGPNSAGNSGHFHPLSNPCQGPNDQPNCPGPH